jgi:hypothetical protein
MYGKLPRNINEKFVDNKRSNRWLKSSGTKGEKECQIDFLLLRLFQILL